MRAEKKVITRKGRPAKSDHQDNTPPRTRKMDRTNAVDEKRKRGEGDEKKNAQTKKTTTKVRKMDHGAGKRKGARVESGRNETTPRRLRLRLMILRRARRAADAERKRKIKNARNTKNPKRRSALDETVRTKTMRRPMVGHLHLASTGSSKLVTLHACKGALRFGSPK